MLSLLEHWAVQPEPNSGCWLWAGRVGVKGHGEMSLNGKHVLCHRASYELERGPIPTGLWVLHRCNNACCCNPDHLYLGTHKDNMRDMKESGRHKMKTHGERSGRAILRESDVIEIIRLQSDVIEIIRLRGLGITQSALAQKYRVSKGCIAHASRGLNWRHI